MVMIGHCDLEAFATDLLVAGGYPNAVAAQTAALLLWANLRGADSHGVLRIPSYVERVTAGAIQPHAKPEFIHSFGAIATLDAKHTPGAVGMALAADRAVEAARTHGIGWCAAINITHAGAIGFFAEKITQAGFIGIVLTASKPLMTYHGSLSEVVSTNPLAIGVPTMPSVSSSPDATTDEAFASASPPILLDMSTSAVALGKVMAARDAGEAIPPGWAVDATGRSTTDPTSVAALLPMAGPKGSGLSLMIEILASVLTSNAIIAPALSGQTAVPLNGVTVALNPAAFPDPAALAGDLAHLATAIRTQPRSEGTERLFLPGERGHDVADTRKREGIPLSAGTWRRLTQLAKDLELTVPAFD